MTSRERFEDWHSRNYDTLPGTELHRVERAGMMKAWRVRDAEVATLQAEADAWRANARDSGVEARGYKAEVTRLVEALRRARKHVTSSEIDCDSCADVERHIELTKAAGGSADKLACCAELGKHIDALLREYTPKEKRDV